MAIKVITVKAKLEELKEEGTYVAYASVFGNVDSDGDIIKQGAFKKTLKKTKGFIPLVWAHDFRDPGGKAIGEEDDRGLLIRGELNLESQRGREVYSFMKQGVVGAHSFAFDPNMKKADRIEDDDGNLTGYEFGELKLYEASPLVNGFAANDQANLVALKWRTDAMGKNNDPEDVDSIETVEVDSLEQAKAMEAFSASIREFNNTLRGE